MCCCKLSGSHSHRDYCWKMSPAEAGFLQGVAVSSTIEEMSVHVEGHYRRSAAAT